MFDLTKGKEVRYVPLSDFAFEKVNALTRFENQPYIFCHHIWRRGHSIGSRWAWPDARFRKIRQSLGLNFITPHVLRHLAATRWNENSVDINSIKLKLGQKDIRTTMIYIEANEDHADEAIRKANKTRQKFRELELAEAAKNSSVGGGKGEDLGAIEAA